MFNSGRQPPGVYRVSILLNDEVVAEQDIRFFHDADSAEGLAPCLTSKQLASWGVKINEVRDGVKQDECYSLTSVSESAKAEFNFSSQVLNLSIPQAALMTSRPGEVPRALWDDGIPAFLLGWQGDINQIKLRHSQAGQQISRYLRFTPGLNAGPWRLRAANTWQKEKGQPGRWRKDYLRLERGFYENGTRMILGEGGTPSDVFDGVPFTGAMFGTDDAMSPGESTFTPIIRGIAQTQARVVVRQNGEILYTRQVPPGPFALDNVPVPGAGGELDVSVEESSGEIHRFSVPWQTPAVALNEGYTRFNLMVGHYRMEGLPNEPVGQATIMAGLPGSVTLYGGLQKSTAFRSTSAGVGVSLGLAGSLSVDATRSRSRAGDGQAYIYAE
ncbi:fimbria/pilus outer membrane usher protein [Enterobacter kobei]|nr:fimbria/pilus outer membrane usher protein [Enterobacter kobei]